MTSEVLVLLEGNEMPQCEECCAPMFALYSVYYSTDTHYYLRADIECENGHVRVVVEPPQPLTPEMKELLT